MMLAAFQRDLRYVVAATLTLMPSCDRSADRSRGDAAPPTASAFFGELQDLNRNTRLLFGYMSSDLPKETGFIKVLPRRAGTPLAPRFRFGNRALPGTSPNVEELESGLEIDETGEVWAYSNYPRSEMSVPAAAVDAEGSRQSRPSYWTMGRVDARMFARTSALREAAARSAFEPGKEPVCKRCDSFAIEEYLDTTGAPAAIVLARTFPMVQRRTSVEADILCRWLIALRYEADKSVSVPNLAASSNLAANLHHRERVRANAELSEITPFAPDIVQVVNGYQAGFRSCYQRALSTDPAAHGDVRLVIRVGPLGEVTSVVATQERGVPSSLVSCIQSRAQVGQFQPPGVPGEVTAKVTLRAE